MNKNKEYYKGKECQKCGVHISIHPRCYRCEILLHGEHKGYCKDCEKEAEDDE